MISNILFEYLLDWVPTGIYILDRQRRYIYANNTYLEFLGMPREALMMRSVQDLLESGKYDNCISNYVFREKRQISVFLNVFVDNGSTMKKKRKLVRAVPLFDEAGEIAYMIGLCDDVDELNECYYEASTRSLAAQDVGFPQPIVEKDSSETKIITVSPVMQQILADAKQMARVDSTILISGTSGTGKELMAEYIHRNSRRSQTRMVVVNCASIPENLLESSLYGYERGAFTGALASGKTGLIEAAAGGTLFLDEINSLPLELQGKLLRTLEAKKIQRVGATREISIDFRLIAATNRDLQEMVHLGLFREDLYYRLNILPVKLPTLRERREDIPPIARYYFALFCEKYKKTMLLTDDALQCLTDYNWPGNVRELRNIIERIVILCSQDYISGTDIEQILGTTAQHTMPAFGKGQVSPPSSAYETMLRHCVSLQSYADGCEKSYLEYALKKFASTYKAAQALQTTQSLVMRRKEKYGL